MKLFAEREAAQAVAYATLGGQALHLHRNRVKQLKVPGCFKGAKVWAHLIDHDYGRLWQLALRLGIRKVKIERYGKAGQHVDLCGRPLQIASVMAGQEEKSVVTNSTRKGGDSAEVEE